MAKSEGGGNAGQVNQDKVASDAQKIARGENTGAQDQSTQDQGTTNQGAQSGTQDQAGTNQGPQPVQAGPNVQQTAPNQGPQATIIDDPNDAAAAERDRAKPDQGPRAATGKPEDNKGAQASDLGQSITQGNPGAMKPGQVAGNPKQVSKEEAGEQVKADLRASYGPGYVTAKKGNETRLFSARSWELLGEPDAKGEKDGWKSVVKEPDEVRALKDRGEQASNG